MKYKYTRKEIVNKWETTIKYSGNDLIRDLLAQKEYKKECIHEGDKTDWHPQFCRKCGAEFMYDFSTPSPLELPKINNNFSSMEQYNWAKKITDEVNKLYQFIKEKK